jgi:hypothetical protein
MQEITIKVRDDQDVQFLLMFLEKMQFSFQSTVLPPKNGEKTGKSKKNAVSFAPKFNEKTADKMVAVHFKPELTNGKNNTIENLLANLGDFYDPEFADNIEAAQKHWKNWTIETM